MPTRYQAVSLELMPGFFCASETPTREQCAGSSTEIYKGYYYCSKCSRRAPNNEYCTGKHNCRVEGFKPTDTSNYHESHAPSWQRLHIQQLRQNMQSTTPWRLSVFDTAHLLVHVTMALYRKEFLNSTGRPLDEVGAFNVRVPMKTMAAPDAQQLSHPVAWDYPVYSPERAIDWESRTGTIVVSDGVPTNDIKTCVDPSMQTVEVNYKKCSDNDQLIALRKSANIAYNTTGPVVLPELFSILIPVSATKLLLGGGEGGWFLHGHKTRGLSARNTSNT